MEVQIMSQNSGIGQQKKKKLNGQLLQENLTLLLRHLIPAP